MKGYQGLAWHLFNDLKVGELRHYRRIVRINGQLCYLSGTKVVRGAS